MTHVDLSERVTRLDCAIHHGGLRSSKSIDMIVMHATEGESAASSIIYLNTTDDKTASYAYLIDRDGSILRMTNPMLVAYHAGDSAWPNPVVATPANPDRPNGGRSVNGRSIGIAWASKGNVPITDDALESALWLCGVLCGDYAIPVERVVSHAEVSPGRKTDPISMPGDEWRALLTRYLADSDA